jgi:hypothetical protein
VLHHVADHLIQALHCSIPANKGVTSAEVLWGLSGSFQQALFTVVATDAVTCGHVIAISPSLSPIAISPKREYWRYWREP